MNHFSNTKRYGFEIIPQNLNKKEKEKWIKNKIEMLSSEKMLIYQLDNKILWVFLEENEKFWLPYEKLSFFKSIFKKELENHIIIEELSYKTNYYAVFENFLIAFEETFEEVVEKLKQLSSKQIEILALVLNESTVQNHNCNQIVNYSSIYPQLNLNFSEEFFLNEDNESYDEKTKISLDEVFFRWLDEENSKSKRFKIKYFATCFFIISFFLILGFYYKYNINIISSI